MLARVRTSLLVLIRTSVIVAAGIRIGALKPPSSSLLDSLLLCDARASAPLGLDAGFRVVNAITFNDATPLTSSNNALRSSLYSDERGQ